ncbi:HAD hydrolase-like protein [Legionella tunisiensis]|uniref:HAD hydrolase-like protein n=1 Tax=Legionella tunisiensis TaxID=1034944 RepID=UPI0003091163|nr:HAD hydrolase-like protein [Legionella tunisiensis]
MKPNDKLFNAIIFDFDGVILDSEPIHYEACDYVLKGMGLHLDYEEYKENYLGLADKTLFPQLLASKGFNLPLDKIDQMIEKNKVTLPLSLVIKMLCLLSRVLLNTSSKLLGKPKTRHLQWRYSKRNFHCTEKIGTGHSGISFQYYRDS